MGRLSPRSPVANTTFNPQTPSNVGGEGKWLLGIAGTWIILTIMVDLGDTADLAVALALVIMGSVVLSYGDKAFINLGLVPGGGS